LPGITPQGYYAAIDDHQAGYPQSDRELGMFIRKTLAATVAAAAMMAGPAAAIDMKIGFVTINDSQHRSADWIAAEVKKRTNGAITPRVFPAAQLGKIPRQIEGVLLGTQEVFMSPPGFFVGLNKALQAADAPGLFTSTDHQNRTLNHPTVREKFLNLPAAKGVKGLFIWSAGGSAYSARKPILKAEDLKGMKIRVLASPMERALMEAVGAAGTPMPYSEVLPALQRKVIDGARAPIVVVGPSKFYTVVPHITIENGNFVPSAFWVSTRWFEKLSSEHQKILTEVGRDATEVAQKSANEIAALWEKKWVEEGGKVYRFPDAERKRLMEIYAPLGDKVLGSDPAIAPMYNLIKAAAKATM
jgi:tripartite ATP-independent transporter DctP family solute receptor